jgi:sugar lactone lactonase YvrE
MKKITLLANIIFITITSNAQCVSTIAGSGTASFADGIGTAALFNGPNGLTVDLSGNIYIADNNKIRKISPTGAVTTISDAGVSGTGPGCTSGVAVENTGNIFYTATCFAKINKITPAGITSTYTGSPFGFVDGTLSQARFSSPFGIAIDNSGNIYVADTGNHSIRKITATGNVITIAGSGSSGFINGMGNAARFSSPKGVAIDNSGNIYVADTGNHSIRKITSTGVVTTIAGFSTFGFVDGIGNVARFRSPTGIAIDNSGDIYVADTGNHSIRKITSTGVVTTIAGSSTFGFVDGSLAQSRFNNPKGIALDSSGNIYVSDSGNNRIRKITLSNASINYSGSPFCKSLTSTQSVTLTASGGFIGGVFSSSPGLILNSTNGNITPNISTAGTYSITYTSPTVNGCSVTTSTQIIITNVPSASMSYSNTAFCNSLTTEQAVILNGTGSYMGGTFSSTSGLSLNSSTGAINPSLSTPGNYVINYTIPASGGCNSITVTRQITITALPTASINYSGSPFCKSLTSAQPVTLSGSGSYTGGTFSSTTGLTISPTNGAITPSTSNAGTYLVTYTTPSSGGCSSVITSTQIIITALPTASISYSGSPFCNSNSTPQNVNLTGTGSYTGGIFSSSVGLTINPTTGQITPSTSNPGLFYTITYTIPSGNGCQSSLVTTQIFINPIPTTNISADGVVATSTTINNGSSVQLQLNGSLNTVPNIQWTPATAINSTTVSNPIVYPSTTTTYTASFTNSNGCQQSTSFVVNVNPQPTIGTLSLTSPSSAAIGLFDTITVDIQLTGATNLYSLFMKLKGNAAVNQYLDYQGFTASTLLGSGSSVISTPPTVTNGIVDFGITKVGPSSGYSGSGLYYTLRFVPKNIAIPNGTVFCFYIDDVSAYNSSGVQCGLNNQGQICYTFTNQVNVWPGDLNKSNFVSTADILPIGYFYNSTGPARPNATIQWNAQPATLWGYNRNSQNGDAYKVFADSNGDGVINNADQTAIGFNMGQVHARQANSKPFIIAPKTHNNTLTVGGLVVTPNNTIINGATLPQTVTFTVNLNNTGGLNALYGISVNLIFDNTIFDLNTASIDYTGSIFGNAGSDCLVMNYNSATAVSVGLTRYVNAAINGQGLLFRVTLQTKSPLGSSLNQTPVTAYVDAANNQAGNALVIEDAPVTNLTIINNLGIDDVKQDEFVLYPNPTNDIVYLSTGRSTEQLENLKLIVFNTLGQIVNEIPIRSSNMQISTRNWGASGVYFVKIVDDSNNIVTTKKIILE